MSAATITVNPSEFCNQFREALSVDLGLSERCCPRCLLHYPDLGLPDACHWEEDGGEVTLQCVYDYEGPPAKQEQMLIEARSQWIADVLKVFERKEDVALYAKWRAIFSARGGT
jgi:hypothetical protein